MQRVIDRRQFLRIGAYGGVVFASSLAGYAGATRADSGDDFFFIQLSDSHWGFQSPSVNPDAEGTLRKVVDEVNALDDQPDFIVFTGDLTHATDDPGERRRRMGEFKSIVQELRVKKVYFIPGEHDASLDNGAAFKEMFGLTHYTFDYEGVHCIALDNASGLGAMLGYEQLQWLASDLARLSKKQRIIVFAHRPLFDLAPSWDWATDDGARALDLLMPFENVAVFYGHIHQEHHYATGHIAHHSAKSLMYQLPAPLSVPNKLPLAWDASAPYKGLGFREVKLVKHQQPAITEWPIRVKRAAYESHPVNGTDL